MPKCKECNDTGVIETGNNDFPCDKCGAGYRALFNVAGRGQVTGQVLLAEEEERKRREGEVPDHCK